MAHIRVPKPPDSAYDPSRRAGTLLQSQLRHLEWAVRPASERQPDGSHAAGAETEAEAAQRIGELTKELHLNTVGRAPVVATHKTQRKRRTRKSSRKAGR
jgi:hypothetical protein